SRSFAQNTSVSELAMMNSLSFTAADFRSRADLSPRTQKELYPIFLLYGDEPFGRHARICRWRCTVNDDREVWEQISQGNVAAFDMLYRENAPRLCAFLRQITGDVQAAEDIVQETFAHVWNKPVGFKPESGSLRGWLFGICRKRAAEWWRMRTRFVLGSEEQTTAGNPELASIIGDAMVRLPQEQRLLLWLREVEGQSYQELAGILELPVGTVRSRLFTAREALRKI